MRQSRLMSLTEAAANIMVGYAVGILTQALVFPILGIETSLRQNLVMAALYRRLLRQQLCAAGDLRARVKLA
jgi:hypothetical protein